MRFVIQRVKNAKVEIDGVVHGKIDGGFLVLVGVTQTDDEKIADAMVNKLVNMRIFEDENGKMNKALKDVGGKLLIISQFTLYANCVHGNRPDFLSASKPDHSKPLYEYVVEKCRECGIEVETGEFGADMKVSLLNDGPVTIILDSNDLKIKTN